MTKTAGRFVYKFFCRISISFAPFPCVFSFSVLHARLQTSQSNATFYFTQRNMFMLSISDIGSLESVEARRSAVEVKF